MYRVVIGNLDSLTIILVTDDFGAAIDATNRYNDGYCIIGDAYVLDSRNRLAYNPNYPTGN